MDNAIPDPRRRGETPEGPEEKKSCFGVYSGHEEVNFTDQV